ncbi:MAG: hypothetical protein N2491_07780 [Negativicutes bacterium]|nr:hypothetical protein [Negativicutes bacterium]
MEFSFKLFEPKKMRKTKNDEPVVQVRPNGRIVFNKKATELLNSNSYCKLGYDAQQNAVGILPITEPDINAFPVRYAARGAYIGAKKFFRFFNILPQNLIENAPIRVNQYIGIKL